MTTPATDQATDRDTTLEEELRDAAAIRSAFKALQEVELSSGTPSSTATCSPS